MEDEVRAVLDRPQQRRAEERVVGDDDEPVAVRELASAARSGIRSRGFVDVSMNRSFVAGVIAASTAARSVMSTAVTPIPRRGRSSCHSTFVIANSSSPTTMWSPWPRCANSVAATLAMPEAATTASSAPSRLATFSSSARFVGLPVRL